MRTFIAIDLPPDIRRDVAASTAALRADLRAADLDPHVRWVPSANLHLTLRFLGEAKAAQVDALRVGLDEAVRGQPPLHLELTGVGCFPTMRRPSVLWLGIGGDVEPLQRLHAQVEQAVQTAGFEAEPRPFSPHLTLGRVRRQVSSPERRRLGEQVCRWAASWRDRAEGAIVDGTFAVTELLLMRSVLAPGGAVYTVVAGIPLAPASA